MAHPHSATPYTDLTVCVTTHTHTRPRTLAGGLDLPAQADAARKVLPLLLLRQLLPPTQQRVVAVSLGALRLLLLLRRGLGLGARLAAETRPRIVLGDVLVLCQLLPVAAAGPWLPASLRAAFSSSCARVWGSGLEASSQGSALALCQLLPLPQQRVVTVRFVVFCVLLLLHTMCGLELRAQDLLLDSALALVACLFVLPCPLLCLHTVHGLTACAVSCCACLSRAPGGWPLCAAP